jgi:hypothetical protein
MIKKMVKDEDILNCFEITSDKVEKPKLILEIIQ